MSGYDFSIAETRTDPSRGDWQGPLPGDFYASEDVTRGATFASFPTGSLKGGFSGGAAIKPKDDDGALLEKPVLEIEEPTVHTQEAEHVISEGHASSDEAPVVPRDPYFHLLPTSLLVSCASSQKLFNLLVRFLSEMSPESLKKSCKKFTAKAEVVHKGELCTVKIRVYKSSDGVFVVELQRRMGDAVAFMSIFRMLIQCLENKTHYKLVEDRQEILPSGHLGLPLPTKRDVEDNNAG